MDREERSRPKKSWREMDQERGRPGGRKKREEPEPSRGSGYQQYLRDLDRLFDEGKTSDRIRSVLERSEQTGSGSERQAMLREIRQAVEPSDVLKALDSFLDAGQRFPDDLDVLVKALNHPRGEVVREAIGRLEAMTQRRAIKRKAALMQRLVSIERDCEDEETRAAAANLRKKLRSARILD